MTAYQLWKDEKGIEYIPQCDACGEYLRSSPAYDGTGPCCMRRTCRKEREATPLARCHCSWTKHHTGEGCPWADRATPCVGAEGLEKT